MVTELFVFAVVSSPVNAYTPRMCDRGRKLKAKKLEFDLKATEIRASMRFGSLDTVRKLGEIGMSERMLDEIERGIETARQIKSKRLQPAG
jgi:hypothetical protein